MLELRNIRFGFSSGQRQRSGQRSGRAAAAAPELAAAEASAVATESAARSARTEPAPDIIADFSLQVKRGEILAILGRSGSGKSTLLHLVAGLLDPLAGELRVDGELFPQRLGKVSLMPQQDMLFSWLNVEENIALPLRIKKQSKQEACKRAVSLLERLDLAEYRRAYPHQLSGGMRQRVSLLRAAIVQNEILLLDEPFSKLDYFTRHECMAWSKQVLQKINAMVVYVSHDIDEVLSFATRIVVVSKKGMRILQNEENNTERPDGEVQKKLKKTIQDSLFQNTGR